ncbi:hypothetical protein T484DRAFT_1803604 [Baffinella frigidus]|jgi:hypothetical protein|nr:hypothetical protein T484DRAFT_1803604 [Cryptophyta sp. CCMP2293]
MTTTTHDELLARCHCGRGNPVGANTPKLMAAEDLAVLTHRHFTIRRLSALFDVPKRISSWAGYPAAHQGVKNHASTPLQSNAASAASTPASSSLELLGTTKKESGAFRRRLSSLAHSRSDCSCAVAQVATRPEVWTVMGRRWKCAKFVQSHNELAARRGASLATINPAPRTKDSTRAIQEHLRTQMASPGAHLRVPIRSDSRFRRRGAASKLPSVPAWKELESTHAELWVGGCAQD